MVATVDTTGCFWAPDSTYILACNKWRCTLDYIAAHVCLHTSKLENQNEAFTKEVHKGT